MKFNSGEEENIFRIAAGILHIGNIEFVPQGEEGSEVKDTGKLNTTAEVLCVTPDALRNCMIYKRRTTGKEVFESPLVPDKARQARDSISKLVYLRLFLGLYHEAMLLWVQNSQSKIAPRVLVSCSLESSTLLDSRPLKQTCLSNCLSTCRMRSCSSSSTIQFSKLSWQSTRLKEFQ